MNLINSWQSRGYFCFGNEIFAYNSIPREILRLYNHSYLIQHSFWIDSCRLFQSIKDSKLKLLVLVVEMYHNISDHILESAWRQLHIFALEKTANGLGDFQTNQILGIVKPLKQRRVDVSQLRV